MPPSPLRMKVSVLASTQAIRVLVALVHLLPLPAPHFTLPALSSLLFLKQMGRSPASGPLSLLFPMPGTFLSQISIWISQFLGSAYISYIKEAFTAHPI